MRCGIFIGILAATLAGYLGAMSPASADQLSDAQTLIQTQTQGKVNYLDKDCERIIPKNGKNVCFLQSFKEVVGISGSRNGSRYKKKIAEEFSTLTAIGTWGVSVARVGSQLMDGLPCKKDGASFDCSGFVEDRLDGSEVSWADAYGSLVEGRTVAACKKTSYEVSVAEFFATKSFIPTGSGRRTLASFVDSLPTSAAKQTFATDLARLADAFSSKAAILDLQTFLAPDGKIIIFDAEDLNRDKNAMACWSLAFAGFSKLASQTPK